MDVDSKIPNLALMKASTYHKSRGDDVRLGFDLFSEPDLCYASKVFSFTDDVPLPGCETLLGGTGYGLDSNLPFDDRVMPDYGLYDGSPKQVGYAMGRFTRGCPNKCPWCVVPKMDGDVRKVADLRDFYAGQKVVRLLDDNIMADQDVFVDACRQLRDADVRVIWDALDIRLVNDVTAHALSSVRHEKTVHFAWDSHAQDGFVHDGISILGRHGMKPWRFSFYILVGYGTSMEYDLERIYAVRDLGANPFVMPYDKSDRRQKDLARWCNNKFVFKKCRDFFDYDCPTTRAM